MREKPKMVYHVINLGLVYAIKFRKKSCINLTDRYRISMEISGMSLQRINIAGMRVNSYNIPYRDRFQILIHGLIFVPLSGDNI